MADKNCIKIEPITNNMYCAGAGTAADCQYVKRNKLKKFLCVLKCS